MLFFPLVFLFLDCWLWSLCISSQFLRKQFFCFRFGYWFLCYCSRRSTLLRDLFLPLQRVKRAWVGYQASSAQGGVPSSYHLLSAKTFTRKEYEKHNGTHSLSHRPWPPDYESFYQCSTWCNPRDIHSGCLARPLHRATTVIAYQILIYFCTGVLDVGV